VTRSGSDGRGRPGHDHRRRWAGPARGSLVGRFTTALVFLCCIETGRLVAAQTLPANVTVRRTTDGLTTRLDIAPRDGRFRVDDIVRSLAEVNGLDTSVFHSRCLPGSFSATSWRKGGYVAALNRMLPRGVDVQYVKRRSVLRFRRPVPRSRKPARA